MYRFNESWSSYRNKYVQLIIENMSKMTFESILGRSVKVMIITYYVNIEETYMYCHIVTVCYCSVYHNSFLIPDGAYSSYTYVGCHKDDEKRDIPYDLLGGHCG